VTELYRGILLILFGKYNDLVITLRDHVRSYKQTTSDPSNYLDVGVMGFWNLMLEISLTVFGISVLTAGVALVAALALIFYPLAAFLNFGSLVVKNTKNPADDATSLKEKIPPVMEEQPVILKNPHAKEKE
jgi:hypothetical protein